MRELEYKSPVVLTDSTRNDSESKGTEKQIYSDMNVVHGTAAKIPGRQANFRLAPCKRIHEGPGLQILASRFRIPASGFWILDSKPLIPDFNLLDSGFQTIVDAGFRLQKFTGFRILLHGAIQTDRAHPQIVTSSRFRLSNYLDLKKNTGRLFIRID